MRLYWRRVNSYSNITHVFIGRQLCEEKDSREEGKERKKEGKKGRKEGRKEERKEGVKEEWERESQEGGKKGRRKNKTGIVLSEGNDNSKKIFSFVLF